MNDPGKEPPSLWLPPGAAEPKGSDPDPPPDGSAGAAIAGVLILVVVVIVVFSMNDSGSKAKKSGAKAQRKAVQTYDDFDAWTHCQLAAKVQLKAPSTAKFAGSGETTRTDLGGGLYRVESWVDAQNSFGAMLRQRFICEVKFPEKKLKRFEFL